MSNYAKQIIYLSQAQYEQLITNQTITVNGATITYNADDIYVTPQADPVTDVQANGTSIVSNTIANIPIASSSNIGLVKINGCGLQIWSTGTIGTVKAPDSVIKTSDDLYRVIVPSNQDKSVFYGLAKAAGDTTQATSSNSVGTYTNNAKYAIQGMLDVPSNNINNITNLYTDSVTWVAGTLSSTTGEESTSSSYYRSSAIQVDPSYGTLYLWRPVPTTGYYIRFLEYKSDGTFIGNHTSYTNSSYTTTRNFTLDPNCGYIRIVRGNDGQGEDLIISYSSLVDLIAQSRPGSSTVVDITVSGTTPTITAKTNYRYTCGEVSTLSFTPSASGLCDIIFTSGSTATVLTVPSTVKWPEWFDPNALEANKTYELNVYNGTLGVVSVWN